MDDDISFKEFWQILLKRKWMIVKIVLLVVCFTLIVSILLPKVYQSESIVSIGYIPGVSGVVSPEDSRSFIVFYEDKDEILSLAMIKNLFHNPLILNPVLEKYKKFKANHLVVEIVSERVSHNKIEIIPQLKIITKANDPDEAKEINNILVNRFLSHVRPKHAKEQELILDQLATLNDYISQLNKDIKRIAAEINSLPKVQPDYDDRSVLFDLLGKNRESLLDAELKRALVNHQFNRRTDYEVLKQPQTPTFFSKPKIHINLLISFVLGVFISLPLALLKEYFVTP